LSLEFVKIINSIEAELSPNEMPKFIKWADSKLDLAWTKALDRFYSAIQLSLDTNAFESLKQESEVYQSTMLELISNYKQEHKISSTYAFLESLANHANVKVPKVNTSERYVYLSLRDMSPVSRMLAGESISKESA